jgi:hypothetical protein
MGLRVLRMDGEDTNRYQTGLAGIDQGASSMTIVLLRVFKEILRAPRPP